MNFKHFFWLFMEKNSTTQQSTNQPTLGRFPNTWAIFPSPKDSKQIREDFGFQ